MSRGGVNKVILIGNLGSDPELRYTPSGAAVANFSVATNETWVDNNGERQERTEWHRVVAWTRLAEICGEYLKKGSKIYIEGRLQTRSWEGQDGTKRYTTEIVARDLQMLDTRGAPVEEPYAEEQYEEPLMPPTAGQQEEEDDLPF